MIRGHVFQNQVFSNDAFALYMDFLLNKKSGVIKGCEISNTNNTVSISEGYIWIKGRPIQIIGTETKIVDVDSSYCKFVCEIDLSKENTITELNQVNVRIIKSVMEYPTLIQEDLTDGGSIFQFPLAQFKTVNGNISEFKSLITKIDYESIYKEIQNKMDSLIDGSEIIKKCKLAPYPIGIIIAFDTDTNPNSELGGEWEKIAIGETLVGQNTEQDIFKELGKSVGKITQTTKNAVGNTGTTILNINQIPGHSHIVNDPGHSHGSYGANGSTGNYWAQDRNGSNNQEQVNKHCLANKTGISIGSNGGNGGHYHTLNEHNHEASSVQPSHICIFWKRVA